MTTSATRITITREELTALLDQVRSRLTAGEYATIHALFDTLAHVVQLLDRVLAASLHELTRPILILSVHQPTRARRIDGHDHTSDFQVDQFGRHAPPDRAVA